MEQSPGIKHRTRGSSCQCSATELRLLDNQQSSQSIFKCILVYWIRLVHTIHQILPLFRAAVGLTYIYMIVVSFPGLLWLQFLIAYSMQKWREKAWEISSHAMTSGTQRVDRRGQCLIVVIHKSCIDQP